MSKITEMHGIDFMKRREAIGYTSRHAIANEIGVSDNTVKSWEICQRPVPQYAINFILREESRARCEQCK